MSNSSGVGGGGGDDDGGGAVVAVGGGAVVAIASNLTISNLEMDVIEAIFSWLPATCIMRLIAVRKEWRHLHENPLVINRQASNSSFIMRATSNFLVICRDFSIRLLKIDNNNGDVVNCLRCGYYSVHLDGFHSIVSSQNGIICFKWDTGRSLLWNPCVAKFHDIPSPLTPEQGIIPGNVNFSFGFSYDSGTNVYKVVSLVHIHGQKTSLLSVYRPDTRARETVASVNYALLDPYNGEYMPDAVLLDGIMHWLAVPTDEVVKNRRFSPGPKPVIFTYNVRDGTFGRVHVPGGGEAPVRSVLGVYNGTLCLYRSHFREFIQIMGFVKVPECEVNVWRPLHKIRTVRTELRDFLLWQTSQHSWVRLGGEEFDDDFLLDESSVLLRCSLRDDDEPYEMVNVETQFPELQIAHMEPYVPTLVRLL